MCLEMLRTYANKRSLNPCFDNSQVWRFEETVAIFQAYTELHLSFS